MPPAPPAAPGKPGLDLKRLPPWAWGVAIAGGALVGYFVLKKAPGGSEEEGDEGSGSGAGAGDGSISPVIASPLDDAMRQALGLQGHESFSGGDSGGGDGDGGGDSGGGDSSLSSDLSALRGSGLTPAQSTAQTNLGGSGPTIYTPGALAAAGVTTPKSGGTSSGGGTSSFKVGTSGFKAQ